MRRKSTELVEQGDPRARGILRTPSVGPGDPALPRGPYRRNANVAEPAAGVRHATSELVARRPMCARSRARLGVHARRRRARCSEPLLPLLVAALWHAARGGGARAAWRCWCDDDDRARELAEAVGWYLPRVRSSAFLPSRGVAYGSGLDPRPHLVGERARASRRCCARRPRRGLGGGPRASACRRPPRARPAPCASPSATDRARRLVAALVAAGYERVDRSRSAASSPRAATSSTCSRRPARRRCASSSSATRSSASASSRSSRSARCATLQARDCTPPREERDARRRRCGRGRTTDGRVPRGLVPLAARAVRGAARGRLAARARSARGRERLEETGSTWPPAERAAPSCAPRTRSSCVGAARGPRRAAAGGPSPSRGSARRSSGRGVAEAENELRGLVGAGHRVLVAFPHRGEAERTHPALRRVEARAARAGRGAAGRARRRLRRVAAAARLRGAVPRGSRCCPRRRSSAAARPAATAGAPRPRDRDRRRPAARRLRRARGPRRRALRRLRHEDGRRRHARLRRAGVQAARTASSCRTSSSGSSRATSAPTAGAPALSKLGGKAWHALKARARARGARDGRGAARAVRRAPDALRGRLRGRRRLDAAARGAPSRTPRPRIRRARSRRSRGPRGARGRWTA